MMTRATYRRIASLVILLTLLVLSAPYPRLTLWPLASHSASADASITDILWPLYGQWSKPDGEAGKTTL